MRALVLRSFAFSLILAAAAGCSGSEAASSEPDDDSSALTAQEVNERDYGLRDHVLARVPASAENMTESGIERWDVFAGATTSGFRGAVFFASDKGNDVRYAFAANVDTGDLTFLMLEKDGSPIDHAKLDASLYDRLLEDVDRLKGLALKSVQNPENCGVKLAVAGLAMVVAIGGGAVLAEATFAFATALAGVILIPVHLLGTLGVAIATVGPAATTAAAVSGYAYVTYKAGTTLARSAVRDVAACLR